MLPPGPRPESPPFRQPQRQMLCRLSFSSSCSPLGWVCHGASGIAHDSSSLVKATLHFTATCPLPTKGRRPFVRCGSRVFNSLPSLLWHITSPICSTVWYTIGSRCSLTRAPGTAASRHTEYGSAISCSCCGKVDTQTCSSSGCCKVCDQPTVKKPGCTEAWTKELTQLVSLGHKCRKRGPGRHLTLRIAAPSRTH